MRKKPLIPRDNEKPASPSRTTGAHPERDPDEHVHSGELEIGAEQDNEDPDDRVHKSGWKKTIELKAEDNPRDPDDLVHENGDEEDE